VAKRTQDHYTRAAKAQGYPARSVFMLQAIKGQLRVAAAGASIPGPGAAPGSWTRCVAGVVAGVVADLSVRGRSGSTRCTHPID
jgi:23S rRNA U2552 (ribose-2'-O)-methylase RlmE/FtsJ